MPCLHIGPYQVVWACLACPQGPCFHVHSSEYVLETSPHLVTPRYGHTVSRFGHVAAQLLGVPRVRLYQDSIFTKRSGDGPTLWHSDLNMAPFDTNDFVRTHTPLEYTRDALWLLGLFTLRR